MKLLKTTLTVFFITAKTAKRRINDFSFPLFSSAIIFLLSRNLFFKSRDILVYPIFSLKITLDKIAIHIDKLIYFSLNIYFFFPKSNIDFSNLKKFYVIYW